MIRKLWLTACFVLLPSVASAQIQWDTTKIPGLSHELKCHPGDPTRCAIMLEPGEKAPVAGVLQTPVQAATLAVRADPDRTQERIDEAVRAAVKVADSDLALEKKYRQIDNDTWSQKLKVTEENHQKQLELVTPSWYEKPEFVAPVAVALTLAAIGGVVAIACELSGCSKN